MTAGDVRLRARHAHDFLETATDARALHPDRTNVVISNAVLAVIAAADAICSHLRGEAARGEAHDEAVRLLASASPPAAACANDLRRLLASSNRNAGQPIAHLRSRPRQLPRAI